MQGRWKGGNRLTLRLRQGGHTDRMADPGPSKGSSPIPGSPSPLGSQVLGQLDSSWERTEQVRQTQKRRGWETKEGTKEGKQTLSLLMSGPCRAAEAKLDRSEGSVFTHPTVYFSTLSSRTHIERLPVRGTVTGSENRTGRRMVRILKNLTTEWKVTKVEVSDT